MRLPGTGDHFGRYRLDRKLGHGGMGVVYAAHDETLNREVALKLVTPHLADDDGFRARFQHEAEVLARLDSPRIVKIFDHGEQDGVLFLVTQLIAGGDLNKLVQREGTLPPALASSVLIQVVEGLADAHAVGVVHRDIKPANVLLRERGRELEAFLCDFGIATTLGADLSRTGTIAGSLPYMAPERHRGDDAGPQGDVYSAGCLLWHTLTGAAPYAGTDVEVAVAHMQAAIPQLPGKDEFSVKANAIIAKAMAKDRRKRYPTARAMLTDLKQLAALAPDAISLPGATQIRQKVVIGTRPRRWVPAAAAMLATLAVIGTTVVAVGAIRDDKPVAAEPPTRATSAAPTGMPGHPVVETPTLRLRGTSPKKAPDAGLVADDPLIEEMLPDVVEELGAGGVQPGGSRPKGPTRTVTSTPQTATATATATATTARPYTWQCWNGTKVYEYSQCSNPYGRRGANWIVPRVGSMTCKAYNESATGGDVEGWTCRYGTDSRNIIHVSRWTSVSTARAYYRNNWFNAVRNEGEWAPGGVRFGIHMTGRHRVNGNVRWRGLRSYDALPWVISVNAATEAERVRGFDLVGGFRQPNRLKGQPL